MVLANVGWCCSLSQKDRISGMSGMERLAAARLREPRKRVLKPEGVAVSIDQQPVRDVA